MADVAVVALRAGETYGGADVTVELTDGDGTAVVGYADGAIVAPFTVQAHGLTGAATLHLIPNASISPANTYYTVTVGDFSMLIEVGAGGGALEDLLVTDPAALAPTMLTAHLTDTTDAHDASAVSFVPNGTIAATNVQAAIQEVRDEAATLAEPIATAHIADTADAHDASAISTVAAGTLAATDVQAALNELDSEKAALAEPIAAAHIIDGTDAHAASAITNTAAGNIVATTVQAAINELDSEKLAVTTAASTYQPLDTDLTGIAALISAADKVPYSTGAGTWALADFSAAARTVLDDTTVGAMLTTMGGAPAASPTFTGTVTTGSGGIAGQVYTSDAVTGSNVAGISNAATYVTAVGFQAAASAPVGATFLTAMGYQAGAAMVTPGTHNVTIGLQAGYQATNVADSVLIGGLAGYQANLSVAGTIIGIGKSAARASTGIFGTFVGLQAGYLNSGDYGFGLGYRALESNTAYEVVAVGHQAGLSNTYYRCVLLGTNAVASGNNQMVIGSSSSPVTSWIPGHDTDTYWDIATANTVKHYAGGQKALEVNATGGAPYLGFFGTAAVAKPTGVAVSAAGIHAALVTLGLIAA